MLLIEKHPEFFYILFIYALLISFMLPASYNPQVRTRG